jgi:hypothetical protein
MHIVSDGRCRWVDRYAEERGDFFWLLGPETMSFGGFILVQIRDGQLWCRRRVLDEQLPVSVNGFRGRDGDVGYSDSFLRVWCHASVCLHAHTVWSSFIIERASQCFPRVLW